METLSGSGDGVDALMAPRDNADADLVGEEELTVVIPVLVAEGTEVSLSLQTPSVQDASTTDVKRLLIQLAVSPAHPLKQVAIPVVRWRARLGRLLSLMLPNRLPPKISGATAAAAAEADAADETGAAETPTSIAWKCGR